MQNNTIQYVINVVGNAQGKIDSINQSAAAASQSVNSFSKNIGKLRDAGLAFDAIATQADKLGGLFGNAFSAGMENELQKQNLTTLLGGDVDAADTLFGKIAEYSKNTVYDKAGLLEAQKTMMSFGIEGEKAFSTLKNIGDIAMGDKQRMQALSLAFSQTTSTGKLMGQDLMQMINAGFNPLQTISDKTGKSMSVLKDEMAKGKISAGDVAQAFQWATEEGSLFYQGAEKAGQTTAGRLNQLRDSVTEIAVQLFNSLQPAINGVMAVAGKVVAFMSEHGKLISVAGVVLGTLVLGIKGITMAMGAYNTVLAVVTATTKAWQVVQVVMNAVLAANPIGLVVVAIGALIGLVALVMAKWQEWGHVVAAFMGPLGMVIHISQQIRANWQSIVDAFKGDGIIAGIKRIGQVLLSGILSPVKSILEVAAKIPGVGKWAQQGVDKINALNEKWNITDSTKKLEGASSAVVSSVGINDKLAAATATKGNGLKTGNGTASATTSVATGGTRNTEIHINIGDMIKQVVFNGTTSENKQEIERNFAECLYRVLGMAQVSVG